MNLNTAKNQLGRLTEKFGFRWVAGCGCLGCLVPVLFLVIFLVAVGWWLFGGTGTTTPTSYSAPRYTSIPAALPVSNQGALLRPGVPTPVYAPTNAQGAICNPDQPSMMGNQAGYLAEGQAAYTPYTGDYSPASQSWYLARANFTGQRRTPYVKGQTLSSGLTVVTGDFDFVLLQDASGAQWFCDPTGLNCQFWR